MRFKDWFHVGSKQGPRPADIEPDAALKGLALDDDKRAVAVRAALRAIFGIARIDDAPWSLSDELGLPIKLQALRAVFIAWTGLLFEGVRQDALKDAFAALNPLLDRLDRALPDFYQRNVMGSDYAVASWQDNVEGGRRAANLVQSIATLEFRTLPFDTDRTYRDFLDTTVFYGPDGRDNQEQWRKLQRSAIAADCNLLRQRMISHAELGLAPLWSTTEAAAFATNVNTREWADLERYTEIWLRERKDGSLIMGKQPSAMAERMVKMASLPCAFWEKPAAKEALKAFDYALAGMENPRLGV
jgi:hypothetical protein